MSHYFTHAPQRLNLISKPRNWDGYTHLMMVGQLAALEEAAAESGFDLTAPLNTITHPKKGGSARTFVTTSSGVSLQVILCALPEEASRMNSAARPDVLAKRVAALGNETGRCALLICPNYPEDIDSLAVAASRAFPRFNRKSTSSSKRSVIDLVFTQLVNEEEMTRVTALIEGVSHAAEWVDAPPEEFHVPQFVEAARDVALRSDAEIDLFEGEQLMHMGAGGVWGVGRAAEHPPALVVLRGPRSRPDAPQMVWVGKGIVYDTGGLSLKPKGSMGGMKMDMGGAAAVLAAFETAAARGEATDLCAILCLAENAIGPNAIRNDDILTLYSGKTVEINNTDAEGRLVLGDGVAYATQHLNPAIVVDVATLTGAQLIATGRHFGAIISNDEDLEHKAVQIGRATGDLVHPLPYCPELLSQEFKSEVADMKNSVKDRMNAQSSCAGHFVEAHLTADVRWLHVDIAGPAFIKDRGTGFGVGLLTGLAAVWKSGDLG